MKNIENLETAVPVGHPAGKSTGPVAAVSARDALIERLKELLHDICLTHRIGAIEDAIVALETNSEPKCEGWIPDTQAVPQEPVAIIRCWTKNGEGHSDLIDWCCPGIESLSDGEHKLYAAPQLQRPPLTADELIEMWHDTKRYANPTAADAHLRYARAIEKKVRGEE